MASTSSYNSNVKVENSGSNSQNRMALVFLTTLFFMWGFLTCLNDILIPHLKSIFEMDYTQTMRINSPFLELSSMSIPASLVIDRIGYQKGIVLGLSVAGLGAFLLLSGFHCNIIWFVFICLFYFSHRITILQVAANPYVAILANLKQLRAV
jgi:FHS family L-fucose permease-like MFS transporter